VPPEQAGQTSDSEICLQSFCRYAEVGSYDPRSGRLEVRPRSSHHPRTSIQGHFEYVTDEVLVVLYRYGGDLYLRIGDAVRRLDDDVIPEWSRQGRKSTFEMKHGNVPVGWVEYFPEHINVTNDPPSSSPKRISISAYSYSMSSMNPVGPLEFTIWTACSA